MHVYPPSTQCTLSYSIFSTKNIITRRQTNTKIIIKSGSPCMSRTNLTFMLVICIFFRSVPTKLFKNAQMWIQAKTNKQKIERRHKRKKQKKCIQYSSYIIDQVTCFYATAIEYHWWEKGLICLEQLQLLSSFIW